MEIIEKINGCETMRELDELRLEVIHAVNSGADFATVQAAFRKKKNSLQRHGHTREKEGYELRDLIV